MMRLESRPARARLLGFVLLACAAAGCRSLSYQDTLAKNLYNQGRFVDAANALDKNPVTEGKDRILFLLDRATILHCAGKYAESTSYFLDAADEAEDLDVIKISEQAGTIVTNENLAEYRPEDYERVLIHVYAAMNYALLSDYGESLVECRQSAEELKHIADERGEKSYRLNPFALYLSGIIYEAKGELNDAYVDYKNLYELVPGFKGVQNDLLRLSKDLKFEDDYSMWSGKFGRRGGRETQLFPKTDGEIVVFFEAGMSPVKVPDPLLMVIPAMQRRSTGVSHANVIIDGRLSGSTASLFDVETTAVRALDDRKLGLIAKRGVAIAGKEVAAEALGRKYGDWAKYLARIVFLASEQPDLRSWLTLPRDLQICRVPLREGSYDVTIQFCGGYGSSSQSRFSQVRVEAGRKVFLLARAVR